jgi:3-dehydroquinate dehydratase-2
LKILVANGVNLDLLGRREPLIYGTHTLADVETNLLRLAPRMQELFELPSLKLSFFQSNHEGLFLDELDKGWSAAIINAGAWTHTSLALADRLAALSLPFIEVHISNLAKRETFRHRSFTAPYAQGICYGFGVDSYTAALAGLCSLLQRKA